MSVFTRIFSWRGARPYARGMRHFNRLEYSEAAAEFDRAATRGARRDGLDAKLARFYSAEAHAKVGIAAYKRGEFPRAREEFERAVCVQGNYPDLYAYLGILDAREGRWAEALDWLDHSLSLSPTQREALAARVVVLEARGESEAAGEDLKRLSDLGLPLPEMIPYQPRVPFTPHCLEDLRAGAFRDGCLSAALERYDRGDWQEALDALDRAVADCPRYPDLRYRRGLLLAELRRREEAVASFESAAALHPGFVDAILAQGLCLLHLGRAEEALRVLQGAVRRKPHYADVAYAQAAAAMMAGRPEAAEAPLLRALAVNPGFWRARIALALVEHSRGRGDRARAELAAAMSVHAPQGPLSSWEREHALERDIATSASAFWSSVAAAHPEYPDVHFQLGMAELDAARFEAAAEAFRRAVRLHPGFAQAHCGLGKLEIRAGKPADAVVHLSRALDLEPGLADVWCLLAEAKMETQDLPGAASAFERAIGLNPAYVDALLGLATVRSRERRTADARGLYERVLEKCPEHPVARARLAQVGVPA